METTEEDYEFLERHEDQFAEFVQDKDAEKLVLDPMNSYQRHQIHQLATRFCLTSESQGDGDERCVCLHKTPEAIIPPKAVLPVWNFGEREFFVQKNGAVGTEVLLLIDGTVCVASESRKRRILSRRHVLSGSCKIKYNAILEYTDQNW